MRLQRSEIAFDDLSGTLPLSHPHSLTNFFAASRAPPSSDKHSFGSQCCHRAGLKLLSRSTEISPPTSSRFNFEILSC
jgi:hypothetical protein